MVLNVGKINNVFFKGASPVTKPEVKTSERPQVKELNNVTPDFNVKTPQKYTSLGVQTMSNGLEIYSYKLANGHKVSIVPMKDSPTTVKNHVNVGSMNETDDIKGISHFLEHMAFNGTLGTDGYLKLNRGDSFKKIDELGGWTNASTNYALTDYVNSAPQLEDDDLDKQLQVIASMTEDLALTADMVAKEKHPVCSEIDMIMDDPQTVAIDQTIRTLFNIQSSSDELVGGSVKHIQALDREKVLNYYNTYYIPDNMHLVITGDVDPQETIEKVSKYFHSKKTRQGTPYEEKMTPIKETVRKDFISDKTESANIMIGFSGPKSNDIKASAITDIMCEYLNSTDAGISSELRKLNTSGFLNGEKISNNQNNPQFLFYAINCADKNSEKALKLVFDKFSNLKAPSGKTLENIKENMIQMFNDAMEYSYIVNDSIGKSAFNGDLEYLANYENVINSITTEDIDEYIKTYLDMSKAAVTVVHPDVSKESIIQNYNEAKNITFNGKSRKPTDTSKFSETVLDNNIKVGFVQSKNNNMSFNVRLYTELPDNINPAAISVLRQMVSRGTGALSEDEFNKYKEDNCLSVSSSVYSTGIEVSGYSNQTHFDESVQTVFELLNNPRLTEENLQVSIGKIKDSLDRREDSSVSLYNEYNSRFKPNDYTKEEILEGLETLTLDDVKALYDYIRENSSVVVTANVPETAPEKKDEIIQTLSKLPEVKPHKPIRRKIYVETPEPVILTKAKNNSQADIGLYYKFERDNTMKERAAIQVLNSILSNSHTIGLFDNLREKEHLAYSVYSDYSLKNDCGYVSLNILTSTDNKDTGNITYENLERSINGFHNQINALVNSEYTDEDLEVAKRAIKANLLNNEGMGSKLNDMQNIQLKNETFDYYNRLFEEIDSLTREDIDNLSRRIFSMQPVYSIVASQDTLDNTKDFLDSLK